MVPHSLQGQLGEEVKLQAPHKDPSAGKGLERALLGKVEFQAFHQAFTDGSWGPLNIHFGYLVLFLKGVYCQKVSVKAGYGGVHL